MKEPYYNQLIEIMLQKPKGMKLSAIARNIYNLNSGLFEAPELYEEIYHMTKQYLYRECKKKGSVFKSVSGKWGYYAIRPHYVKQLKLRFK